MRVRYLFSSRHTGVLKTGNKHRKPYPSVLKDVIRISDVVLEVLDARFINETRNKDMEDLVTSSGKVLMYIINKCDLVDIRELQEKPEVKILNPKIFFSVTKKIGKRKLGMMIKIAIKRLKVEKKHAKAHVGIMGYPNTGKSSLLNYLTGRGSSPNSAQAGFTRGIQHIRFTKDILILDTPGIFPEREDAATKGNVLERHTKVGIQTYDRAKDPDFVVSKLMQENKGAFEKFYDIEADGDPEILLETLAKRLNFLKKKGIPDTDRAARCVLKDWQEGKIRAH